MLSTGSPSFKSESILWQFFAFLMIIFFGEVASGVLVYYQVSGLCLKKNGIILISFQESNYESMIDKSVRNTVELQYNSSNVAVLQTFDLLQEGVGDDHHDHHCHPHHDQHHHSHQWQERYLVFVLASVLWS